MHFVPITALRASLKGTGVLWSTVKAPHEGRELALKHGQLREGEEAPLGEGDALDGCVHAPDGEFQGAVVHPLRYHTDQGRPFLWAAVAEPMHCPGHHTGRRKCTSHTWHRQGQALSYVRASATIPDDTPMSLGRTING